MSTRQGPTQSRVAAGAAYLAELVAIAFVYAAVAELSLRLASINGVGMSPEAGA